MDGVATPIIGRPRPLPGHDTPNPAYHPHTLNYEEPHLRKDSANHIVHLIRYSMSDASYTHHGHMHPSYSTPLHIRFT